MIITTVVTSLFSLAQMIATILSHLFFPLAQMAATTVVTSYIYLPHFISCTRWRNLLSHLLLPFLHTSHSSNKATLNHHKTTSLFRPLRHKQSHLSDIFESSPSPSPLPFPHLLFWMLWVALWILYSHSFLRISQSIGCLLTMKVASMALQHTLSLALVTLSLALVTLSTSCSLALNLSFLDDFFFLNLRSLNFATIFRLSILYFT